MQKQGGSNVWIEIKCVEEDKSIENPETGVQF